MSERYEQLLAQAHVEFAPDSKAVTKRFAELVVRECMSEIERVRQIKVGNAGPEYNQAFDDGMFVAIATIEEHFGIEEESETVEYCPTCNEPWSGTSCGLDNCGWVTGGEE